MGRVFEQTPPPEGLAQLLQVPPYERQDLFRHGPDGVLINPGFNSSGSRLTERTGPTLTRTASFHD
jgi:hypothetical protein